MQSKSLTVRLNRILLLGALAGVATPSLAGTISAELDHQEGAVGEPFVLTVMIDGARDGRPEIPAVEGLEMQQQGASESTSWVNGRRSAQLQLGIVIVASKAGTYTIPSIKAKVDGQEVATLPLTIKVLAGVDQAQSPAAKTAPKAGAAGKGQAPQQAKDAAEGVFLERTCDNLEPYVGEQVLCTIQLYHRGNLSGGQRLMPSSPDFRRFPIEGEKPTKKLVNGQPYIVIELKEVVVPTKAGALVLPPFTIDARILTWSKRQNPLNKLFDRFGGNGFNFDMNVTEEHEVTLKSTAADFAVKPLPAAGKPANFSGLVGSFHLETKLSQAKVSAGNTITITITISGIGIADALPEIVPDLDKIGKIYPDKPEYTEKAGEARGIMSKRVYKYALVPAHPGDYDLGKVEVPVFNPQLQQYTTLSSELGHLIVDPSKAEAQQLVVGQQPLVPGTKKQDVKVLGSDLIEIHHDHSLTSQQTITRNTKLVLVLVASSTPSLAFAFLGWDFVRRRSKKDVIGRRRSQAYKLFKSALQSIQVQLAAGHVEPALLATYVALRTYLGNKLNLRGQTLAAREIADVLRRLGSKESDLQRLIQIITVLEQVDFSGRLPSLPAASELVADLDHLILGLESV